MAAVRADSGELLDQRLGRLRIADEIDRDTGAFLGKADRRRPPDPGRRTGDQHPLAFEARACAASRPSCDDARSGPKRQDGRAEYGYMAPVFRKFALSRQYDVEPARISGTGRRRRGRRRPRLGLVNMMRGGSGNRSQQLMRWRVILQFVAIVVMMTALYFGTR